MKILEHCRLLTIEQCLEAGRVARAQYELQARRCQLLERIAAAS